MEWLGWCKACLKSFHVMIKIQSQVQNPLSVILICLHILVFIWSLLYVWKIPKHKPLSNSAVIYLCSFAVTSMGVERTWHTPASTWPLCMEPLPMLTETARLLTQKNIKVEIKPSSRNQGWKPARKVQSCSGYTTTPTAQNSTGPATKRLRLSLPAHQVL